MTEKLADLQNAVIWFGGEHCNVCQVMRPKVRAMIEAEFPELDFIYIDTEQHPETTAQYQVFTVPVAIALLDGREYFRWARAFGLDQIREQLSRPYHMLFGSDD